MADLLASRLRTAGVVTASFTLLTFDADDYDELIISTFVAGAVSGTTPTLRTSLNYTTPGGETGLEIQGGYPALTAQFGHSILSIGRGLFLSSALFGIMRVQVNVGGTTPSFSDVEVSVWGSLRGDQS